MEGKREYFFKKGNKFGQGQPQSSKKQMEIIRRRILTVVRRRVYHEKDLSTVSTTDLIKFLATIMPKDYSLAVRPEVNYISNVPREDPTPDEIPTTTAEALSSPDTTIMPDTSNGTSEENEQEASPQVEDTTSTEPITSTSP